MTSRRSSFVCRPVGEWDSKWRCINKRRAVRFGMRGVMTAKVAAGAWGVYADCCKMTG